tara:strand:+ start:1506 stop:1715 length:210 start_codon:yes stop_codon:yes gene_type:complete
MEKQKTMEINGQDIPLVEPTEVITTLKNIKTGEIYKDEEALKAANVSPEDVQRDVLVKMPTLDLFGKTK